MKLRYRIINCDVCNKDKKAFVEIPTKRGKIIICEDCMEELNEFGVHVELKAIGKDEE